MIYILDTADLAAIKHCNEFYPLAGVTTNPSIISKENTEFWGLVKEIRSIIGKDKMLHVQTVQTTAEKMIEEAKEQAQKEAQRIVVAARENIEYEKLHAMTELKNQIANLSIEIAEDLLKHELSDKVKSNEIISKRMSEINLK